jgi:acyl-CoA synthetase (NDP forming)
MENGLEIAPLSSDTRQKLSDLLGEVGGIFCNPVDVSQAQFRGLPTLLQAIDLIVRDTASDVVLIQEDVEILLPIYSRKGLQDINEFIIELGRRQSKPIVIVLPPGSVEAERLEIEQRLLAASVPVFYSMERAAKAIVRLNQYSCRQEAE